MRTVLVTVLDWGLGHATRCVPVIRELQKQNWRVIVGGSGPSLSFLKEEFPELSFRELPSYNIQYPKNGRLILSLLRQLPKILKQTRLEKKRTQEIVRQEDVSCIISDNRYGCYSENIKSIFICHQLNLQLPKGFSFLSGWVNSLHLKRVKNFGEVWIPDELEGFKFSGILSKNALCNVRCIGILSRFKTTEISGKNDYEIVAIVSGPEPQRTIFENILRELLLNENRRSILIKGKPGSTNQLQTKALTEVDHLNSKELESVLMNASVVITRPGYSSIMDLATLGKKVIFVPTPGQTEQEYLAEYFHTQGIAVVQSQNAFNLRDALSELKVISSIPLTKPNVNLVLTIQCI